MFSDPTPEYLYDEDWLEDELPDWIGVMESAATLFENLNPQV